ncbi:MAG: NAD(P)-dependent glycerol-3-phosphate dehydrogenase [Deltaproteobacteria bacterium]|nr:NAD(P)-dependent glycerol-3-phosphate dehydrogenase [Deltaproteobacteria bacterium]
MTERLGDKVLVLGSGNFGTCLAQHLAEKGYHVTIWSRSQEVVDSINQAHKNPKYLSTINLSSRLRATKIIDQASVDAMDVVIHATPTQTMREVLTQIAPFWRPGLLLICAAKGLEVGSLELPSQIIGEVLGESVGERAAFLSGPSFASEIMSRQPTAVTAASYSQASAQRVQSLFHSAHFRVYTSDDPVGLEVAGALKNVVAIAAGACVGIGFQMNSRAALITRGLAEIMRFGVALGANPITFNGLSGVGDLFLTCTSEKSRNFSVGHRLGLGQPIDKVLAEIGVAEGVATAKAAHDLALKLHVDAPITSEVYRVLYENKPIAQAVMGLLTREAKPEVSF